jgi:hypothetical protein
MIGRTATKPGVGGNHRRRSRVQWLFVAMRVRRYIRECIQQVQLSQRKLTRNQGQERVHQLRALGAFEPPEYSAQVFLSEVTQERDTICARQSFERVCQDVYCYCCQSARAQSADQETDQKGFQ